MLYQSAKMAWLTLMTIAWITPAASQQAMHFNCSQIQGRQSQEFYETNPSYVDQTDDTAHWVRALPADEHIDETRLKTAAKLLGSNRKFKILSFLVVRNDKLVFEQYFNGSTARSSNNVHSASKSMWGALIGIAIDEKIIPDIDTRLIDVLPPKYKKLMVAHKSMITIRHLLTMSSGLNWEEDKTEYQIERLSDRVAAILSRPLAAEPGTKFNYSTGDAHLLSAALSEALKLKRSPQSVCEYAHSKLFAPIGIVAKHWARDPQGYFSGGYSLYLTARELAKFGILYANSGDWNGTTVVPTAWVERSLSPQIRAKAHDSSVVNNYGFDFWLGSLAGRRLAFAWGHGGQMIYIFDKLRMIVVLTTDTYRSDPDDKLVAKAYESVLTKHIIPAATATQLTK
jgi:CubicO group peptidase (beta-lactamase class C family)